MLIDTKYLIEKNSCQNLVKTFIEKKLSKKEMQTNHLDYGLRDSEYDYKRINYFVHFPNKIEPIIVDCKNIILDGMHRLIAMYILKYEKIEVIKKNYIDIDKILRKMRYKNDSK